MKSIEDIYYEFVCGNTVFITLEEGSNLKMSIYPDRAFIVGRLYDCNRDFYVSTKRVALTGDFEDDLYYLIELLLEDAKVAQTA